MANGPGVVIEVDVDVGAERLWPLVTDVDLPARFSDEFMGGDWLDEPGLGARFVGRNQLEGMGRWETTSTVTAWEPNRRFGWAVGDPDDAAAHWAFELEPLAGATRLRQRVVLGSGPSGVTAAVAEQPDAEALIVAGRRAMLAANMQRTLEGIKAVAEQQ
ncbi:MAG: SRPBCC family protein [Acidimicrobiia bacterium]|nr:SRPBCC family protein [Acidimicrobiia bacterium]